MKLLENLSNFWSFALLVNLQQRTHERNEQNGERDNEWNEKERESEKDDRQFK